MNSNNDKTFNQSPAYLFVFSHDHFIVKMNNALLQHLEYEEKEVIGVKKIEDIITVGSKIFLQTHFLPLIRMEKNVSEIFLNFRTKNNLELPVLLNIILQENHDDTFEIHCGGMQISKRNQYERDLMQAKNTAELALKENKELVAAGIALEKNQKALEKQLQDMAVLHKRQSEINKVLSHDLQEQLRKVSVYSNKLLTETSCKLDNENYKSLKKITDFINRVRIMIDKLQQYHQLDHKAIHYSLIDLKPIIEGIVAELSKKHKPLKVECDFISMPKFKGDVNLITQLFKELITNSIKFRQENQNHIKIEIEGVCLKENIYIQTTNNYKYEPFVKIILSDNCSGFYSQNNKIFELFRRDHDVNTRGVGLATCQKIIEMHGGRISVKSKVGVGTVFSILLPLKENIF